VVAPSGLGNHDGPVPFTFRRLAHADLELLSRWLDEPHVHPWWPQAHDVGSLEAEYGPAIDGDDPTEVFIVERDGTDIAFVQRYRFDDNPEWVEALAPTGAPADAAGIDYLIGCADLIGRGIGTAIIGELVEDTWRRYPDVSAIVVDVDERNRRSWRALEKVGFERIWSGQLETDDPSDEGPAHVHVLRRPG